MPTYLLAIVIGLTAVILLERGMRIRWRQRAPSPAPVATGPPRRLSLIGYWSVPEAPPDQSPGWPDPHDLVGGWGPKERRAVAAYLERGTVCRQFTGASVCRFCGREIGFRELTDGRWVWPEGLGHYVEAHDVRLPEAFLASVRAPDDSATEFLAALEPEIWVASGYETASPVELKAVRTWVVDDTEWRDWAAARTPPHPNPDAATLEEIRALCDRLSHPKWRAEVEEFNGRWRLHGAHGARWYLQKCTAGIFERRLLRLRTPDERHLLAPEQANDIAKAADGTWGAIRVLAASTGGWFVWSKRPADAWPTTEEVDQLIKQGLRFDQTGHTSHGRFFVIPPPDEPTWRWGLTLQREEREAMSPQKTEEQQSDMSSGMA